MGAPLALLLAAALEFQPWGDAAFEQASREQMPVVLLVAGDQGLSEPALVRFVPVAVDPVERPDIADLYRTAASLLPEATPLPPGPALFLLTPERRPFAAAPLGGTSLAAFLDGGASLFREHRSDVEARAGAAIALLREAQQGEPARGPLGEDTVARALKGLVDAMDPVRGGFRTAPKAPPHGTLRFLIEEVQRRRNADALRLLRATLDGMAGGAIHGPGGGFFPGAEDKDWGRPFRGKRLADNALLLRAYALAHGLTGETSYREVADEIASFCVGQLREEDGTFDAALHEQSGDPLRDGRVLAGWNGLMISGLAASGRGSDLAAAERAATALLQRLGPAALLRRFGRGEDLGGSALLEDYAFLIEGLLDLAEADGDRRWIDEASSLAAVAVARFLDADRGGFFDADERHGTLPVRIRNGYDGDLPSANGAMASALLKLARATGETRHAAMARKTVEAFLGDLQRAPRGLETLAAAAGELLGKDTGSPPVEPVLPARAVRGPVTVEGALSVARVRAGGALEARVLLQVAPGFSVNPRAPGKDLQGLSVSVPGEDFVASAPRYPEPARVQRGQGPVAAYAGSVTVTVPLRVRAARRPGEARVRLRVVFQACDVDDCRAPDSAVLDVPVTILAPGR